MKSGWVSPHTHACIPPIDVPITRRRCVTPRLSVRSRCCARTMSSYVYRGNLALRPSLGFEEPPWPIPSGITM